MQPLELELDGEWPNIPFNSQKPILHLWFCCFDVKLWLSSKKTTGEEKDPSVASVCVSGRAFARSRRTHLLLWLRGDVPRTSIKCVRSSKCCFISWWMSSNFREQSKEWKAPVLSLRASVSPSSWMRMGDQKVEISTLPHIDPFALGALCAIDSHSWGKISIFLGYTNGHTGVKEMKSFFRKSPAEMRESQSPPSLAQPLVNLWITQRKVSNSPTKCSKEMDCCNSAAYQIRNNLRI